MERYNMFHQVHQGLRALLYETALLIQRTDFSFAEEAGGTAGHIEQVVSLFEKHAHTEDSFVFPMLAGYEPSVVTTFEEEHVEDHVIGKTLEDGLKSVLTSENPTERILKGKELQRAYIRFMVFNLQHMAAEEDIINNLLWRYYSDEELQAVTGRIIAHVAPDAMQQYSRWMVRGLNNTEILHWLQGVKATAPAPVFERLLAIMDQELPPARSRFIREMAGMPSLAA